MTLLQRVNTDKNLYAVDYLPLITVYDDNWFVRNDYDVLSLGQRQYLIAFFNRQGFKQKTGKSLIRDNLCIHLVTPNSNLAVSNFNSKFVQHNEDEYFAVTPTMFAEALFYYHLQQGLEPRPAIEALINKCPYNIEWLRDVSYRSPIEQLTALSYKHLVEFQKDTVERKFKMKKAL